MAERAQHCKRNPLGKDLRCETEVEKLKGKAGLVLYHSNDDVWQSDVSQKQRVCNREDHIITCKRKANTDQE